MKLTTNKPFIVYKQAWRNNYSFCGIRYFKDNVNKAYSIPILYTEIIEVARVVVEKLNKELIVKG